MQKLNFFGIILLFLISAELFSQTGFSTKEADRLLNEKKFNEAEEIYKALSVSDPYNGYIWSNYAYCLYSLKKYPEAIDIYKKSIETGFECSSNAYNIACCYSLINDAENAVQWIHMAAKYKFNNLDQAILNDKDFDNIRSSKKFTEEVIPSADMISGREAGWKTDLKFMKQRMEETHFDIFRNISREEWDKQFKELENKITSLDDPRVFTEMLKITSKVGDGHTTIYTAGDGKFKMHYLPLQFFIFEDGLYIIQASPEYKELAGKKIVKIGNTATENLLTKIRPVASLDNELALKWSGMFILTENDVLYGLGITPKNTEAVLTLEGGKEVTVASKTESENPIHSPGARNIWEKGWKTDPAPLYLKNRGELYWFEYIPEQNMVYMQLNGIGNMHGENLSDFSNRVFKFIDSVKADYFVLDIRFNGGGNNTLNKPLVQEIIKSGKINTKGRFFTIIGRNTFSAAQCLANSLETETNVIFAGEPTGSKPNFIGESSMIRLPYSSAMVSCSSRYWQSYFSDDNRKWIAPQISVKYYSSDYLEGKDPALDAIINFINEK